MNLQGAVIFLLNFAFSVYSFLVLTRFVLQLARADFYNPISQFVLKATNPLLMPLRKIVPGYGGVDVASLVLLVLLVVVKVLVIGLLSFGVVLPVAVLLQTSLLGLAGLILDYVFWMVLIRVILSWVAPDPYNPVVRVIVQITEPIMAPVRKMLPPMGGFDLSPMLVLLGVQFLKVLFGLGGF